MKNCCSHCCNCSCHTDISGDGCISCCECKCHKIAFPVPNINPPQPSSGYICPNCGQFAMFGWVHLCSKPSGTGDPPFHFPYTTWTGFSNMSFS